MKLKLENVTPQIARDLLKLNNRNRRVRASHVDYLASEMANGRWQVTSETIAIGADGTIVDGQHRLLAVAQSGVEVQLLIARDVPTSTQDVIDGGIPRSISDQLFLADGTQNACQTVAAARTIVSICCYFQNLKISTSVARIVIEEYGSEIEELIRLVRQYRPGHKSWVIGALAFAVSADRKAIGFAEAFGTGENLSRGNPAKAAREWFLKDSKLFNGNYKKPAIEGLLNAAYNSVLGNEILTIKSGCSGLDYFTNKNRKFVNAMREQLAQQLAEKSRARSNT